MDRVKSKRNISLVGFMCSGKSSVGREAARRTGLKLVDFDAIIEKRLGMTVAQIFSRHGEKTFRDLETDILRHYGRKERQFLIPGGGIVVRSENRKLLRESANVIWLRIGIDELYLRIGRLDDSAVRPLLPLTAGDEGIAALLAEREKYYKECDLIIDVDGKEFAEVVDRVVESVQHFGFG
jgi:shikimate kinase